MAKYIQGLSQHYSTSPGGAAEGLPEGPWEAFKERAGSSLAAGIETPLTVLNQLVSGVAVPAAGMVSYGKNLLSTFLSGLQLPTNVGSMHTGEWDEAEMKTLPLSEQLKRASSYAGQKAEETEADMAKIFQYQPKTSLAQQQAANIGKAFETAAHPVRALANVEGGLYKPLGLKNLTEVAPEVGKYTGVMADLMMFKAAHSAGKAIQTKYRAKADAWRKAKEGEITKSEAELLKESLDELKEMGAEALEAAKTKETINQFDQLEALKQVDPKTGQSYVDYLKEDLKKYQDKFDVEQAVAKDAPIERPIRPSPTTQPTPPIPQPKAVESFSRLDRSLFQKEKPQVKPEPVVESSAKKLAEEKIAKETPVEAPPVETPVAPTPDVKISPQESSIAKIIKFKSDKQVKREIAEQGLLDIEAGLNRSYPSDAIYDKIDSLLAPEYAESTTPYFEATKTPKGMGDTINRLRRNLTEEYGDRATTIFDSVLAKLESEGMSKRKAARLAYWEAVKPELKVIEGVGAKAPEAPSVVSPEVQKAQAQVDKSKYLKGRVKVDGVGVEGTTTPPGYLSVTIIDQNSPAHGATITTKTGSRVILNAIKKKEREFLKEKEGPKSENVVSKKMTPEQVTETLERMEKAPPRRTPEEAYQELRALDPEVKAFAKGEPVDVEALKAKIRKISDEFDPNNPSHDAITGPSDRLLSLIAKEEMARGEVPSLAFVDDIIANPKKHGGLVEASAKLEAVGEKLGLQGWETESLVAEMSRRFGKELDVQRKAILEDVETVKKSKSREVIAAAAKRLRERKEKKLERPEQLDEVAARVREERAQEAKPAEGIDAEAAKKAQELRDAIRYKKDPEFRKKMDQEAAEALTDMKAEVTQEGLAQDLGSTWDIAKSILKDESGQLTFGELTPAQVAAIARIKRAAGKFKKDMKKLLEEAGLDPDTIAFVMRVSRDHLKDERVEPKLTGPYKDIPPESVLQQADARFYKGAEINSPPVLREAADAIVKARDIKIGGFRDWQNPIRLVEELPKELRKFYYNFRSADKTSSLLTKAAHKEVDAFVKQNGSLSKKEAKRITAYAIAQEKGLPDMQKVLEVNGFRSVPNLSPKEMKVYEFLQKKYAEHFGKQQEVRLAIGKAPLNMVENYIPHARAYSFLERIGIKTNPVLDQAGVLTQQLKGQMDAANPFQKKRWGKDMPLDMDPVAVYKKYVANSNRSQHISPVMAEIQTLLDGFHTPDGKFYNPTKMKPKISQFLSELSNYVGGYETSMFSKYQHRRAISNLNRRVSIATLSGLVSSILVQPAALANTWAAVGLPKLLEGTARLMNPSEIIRAHKTSEHLFSRALDLSIAERTIGNKFDKVADWGLYPLKLFDLGAATVTWLAAEAHGKTLGLKGADLIRYADDLVVKTQSSTQRIDTPRFLRTPEGRLASNLQTFMINDWNFLVKDVLGIGRDTPMTTAFHKAARLVMAGVVINAVYKSLGLRPPTPDIAGEVVEGLREDKSAYQIAWDVAGEGLEKIPYVGNIKYGKAPISKPIQTVLDMFQGRYGQTPKKEIERYIDSGFDPAKFPINTAEIAGTLTGVPGTAQAGKYFRGRKADKDVWPSIIGTPKEEVAGGSGRRDTKAQPRKRYIKELRRYY